MMGKYFTVVGPPRGKERPRFTRSGHAYTPKTTAEYQMAVRTAYEEQVDEEPISGDKPVKIDIHAVFPILKSDSKSVREDKISGKLLPAKKPDCDNIAKIICDALNGLAYVDDKQIVECRVTKHYGEEPCVEVMIKPL